ncbi:MAG: hypothetical protein WDN31_19610 [Hyphomicrobium sp.]
MGDPWIATRPSRADRSCFRSASTRIGLIALKAPYLALLLIVVLTALAGVGLSRLQVDDSLSELFRTETEEFPPLRGDRPAVPVERVRRARRRRGQGSAEA